MTVPVLFLEPDSGYRTNVEKEVAQKTVKNLITTLIKIRRLNSKISINTAGSLSQQRVSPEDTLQTILTGPNHRDEWLLLKELKAKSPLSNGLSTFLETFDIAEARTECGQISTALTWASLLETGTVSLKTGGVWDSHTVNIALTKINPNGELLKAKECINNLSEPDHVTHHSNWLKSLGFDRIPSAKKFWTDKESQFPKLRFLDQTKGHIEALATSGAPYKQALSTLEALNEDASRWDGNGQPQYSIKVADGEHDQRQSLSRFTDETVGKELDFDRHAYFTGGFPGRIHFRVDINEKKFVIAYIGFKLKA